MSWEGVVFGRLVDLGIDLSDDMEIDCEALKSTTQRLNDSGIFGEIHETVALTLFQTVSAQVRSHDSNNPTIFFDFYFRSEITVAENGKNPNFPQFTTGSKSESCHGPARRCASNHLLVGTDTLI